MDWLPAGAVNATCENCEAGTYWSGSGKMKTRVLMLPARFSEDRTDTS